MDLLFASIDPSRGHEIELATAWHGRLMVLAWSVLTPIGILSARFLKILPKQDWPNELDNRFWWHTHWILQSASAVSILAAIVLIWGADGPEASAWFHRLMGWTVVIFVVAQILAGLVRGSRGGPEEPNSDGSFSGDHFDMTPRRLAFEYLHKFLGYIAVLLSWGTTMLGMWVANGPVWMFAALTIWYCALLAVFAVLQNRGFAVDTYQAIWGPDPNLPGNKRKPIGIGVHRRTAERAVREDTG